MASVLVQALHSVQVSSASIPNPENVDTVTVPQSQHHSGSSVVALHLQCGNERKRVEKGDNLSCPSTNQNVFSASMAVHCSSPAVSLSTSKKVVGYQKEHLSVVTREQDHKDTPLPSPSFLGAYLQSVPTEPSPLGLTLKKTPSLLDFISLQLSQETCDEDFKHGPVMTNKCGTPALPECTRVFASTAAMSSTISAERVSLLSVERECSNGLMQQPGRPFENLGSSCIGMNDKLKASNFPATSLKMGSWERKSKYEGDLVAKCYYAKRKLVWEILESGLKSKIEIQWGDISSIAASLVEGCPGTLEIETSRAPMFFKETNPQPRKHTLWQATPDFTGQGNGCRKHVLIFPEGVLNKHYEKLMQCDPRLRMISKGTSGCMPQHETKACASPPPFPRLDGYFGHPYPYPPPGLFMNGVMPYPYPPPYPFHQHQPYFQPPYMHFQQPLISPAQGRMMHATSSTSAGIHPMSFDHVKNLRDDMHSPYYPGNVKLEYWNSPSSVMERQKSDDDRGSGSGSAESWVDPDEEDESVFDDLFLMLTEPQITMKTPEDGVDPPSEKMEERNLLSIPSSSSSISKALNSSSPTAFIKQEVQSSDGKRELLDVGKSFLAHDKDKSKAISKTIAPMKSGNGKSIDSTLASSTGITGLKIHGSPQVYPSSGLKVVEVKKEDGFPVPWDDNLLLDTSSFLPLSPSEFVPDTSFNCTMPGLGSNKHASCPPFITPMDLDMKPECPAMGKEMKSQGILPGELKRQVGLHRSQMHLSSASQTYLQNNFSAARVDVTWTKSGWVERRKAKGYGFSTEKCGMVPGRGQATIRNRVIGTISALGEQQTISCSPPKKKDRKLPASDMSGLTFT